MRSVELGVPALAVAVGVTPTKIPLEYQEWNPQWAGHSLRRDLALRRSLLAFIDFRLRDANIFDAKSENRLRGSRLGAVRKQVLDVTV
jgi:hypothetical protein